VNNNPYEILIMLVFGAIGYVMRKTGFEPAPLIFAMVIGPIMETALRQSLLHSRGNFGIFFHRPISAVLLGAAILILFSPLIPGIGKQRETLVKETPED
jgi:putative tricarboxylic transport membrane protein